MQCTENTQKDSGTVEHKDLAQGGAKIPHESSYSNKEQPIVGSPLKNIEEHQLAIIGHSTAGWIQVKPKKGKKG